MQGIIEHLCDLLHTVAWTIGRRGALTALVCQREMRDVTVTTVAGFVWKIPRYVEDEHHHQDRARAAIRAKRASGQLYFLTVKPVPKLMLPQVFCENCELDDYGDRWAAEGRLRQRLIHLRLTPERKTREGYSRSECVSIAEPSARLRCPGGVLFLLSRCGHHFAASRQQLSQLLATSLSAPKFQRRKRWEQLWDAGSLLATTRSPAAPFPVTSREAVKTSCVAPPCRN